MYLFKPLSECKINFSGTTSMTAGEVAETLKPFYAIVISGGENQPDVLCKTPPVTRKREIVMFNVKEKRIGISEFNIPCALTLEATSDEIKEAIEIFYRDWSDWEKEKSH